MKLVRGLSVIVVVAVVAAGSAYTIWAEEDSPPKAAVARPQKVCSAFTPYEYRDSISVPHTWSAAACNGLRLKWELASYQLVCLFPDGSMSIGKAGGGIPTPNCSWE